MNVRLPSAPTAEPDRLQLLDAVRGFALFGVLLVNLRSFSLYGFLPEAARAELPTAGFDRLLAGVTALLVSIALFYGVGLGIGPRFGLVGVSIAAGAIFLAQAAVSAWWLARFRFGPMEWLWRSLSYGRAQPMRRDPRPAECQES